MEDSSHREHRPRQAGRKHDKKKNKNKEENPNRKEANKNPRAFGFTSSARAQRSQRRNVDLSVKREHLPIVSHTPQQIASVTQVSDAVATHQVPPPVLITVVGPPSVGKSTLIRSLVRHYTSHTLHTTHGPLTVLANRTKRITLIECPSTSLHAMVDIAKISDVVLLMVDGAFGFEMETFEFLNILKIHGMTRVMGILTHLDKFKTPKALNATKKKLKHRFWTEVCDGAKMFYFSGLINGKYPKREVLNLSRFLSQMKVRPTVWRSQHPYVLADRIEDLTDPALVEGNRNIDRNIALFGYVRGTMLRQLAYMHFCGVGDFTITSLSIIDDPVPLVSADKYQPSKPKGKSSSNDAEEVDPSARKVRRKLNEKERVLYAPMSDVGDVLYDEDAIYIQMKDKHVHYTKPEMLVAEDPDGGEESASKESAPCKPLPSNYEEEGAGPRMVRTLQDVDGGIDKRMENLELQLFKNTALLKSHDVGKSQFASAVSDDEDEDLLDVDSSANERIKSVDFHESDGRVRRRVLFDGKQDVSENDVERTVNIPSRPNIMKMIYGDGNARRREQMLHLKRKADRQTDGKGSGKISLNLDEDSDDNNMDDYSENDDDDDFFRRRSTDVEDEDDDEELNKLTLEDGHEWSDSLGLETIRDRFVTGNWDNKRSVDNDDEDDMFEGADDDESIDSDEDEKQKKLHRQERKNRRRGQAPNTTDDADISVDFGSANAGENDDDASERRMKQKAALKVLFNNSYDGKDKTEGDNENDDDEAADAYLQKIQSEAKSQQIIDEQEFSRQSTENRLDLLGATPGQYVRIELSGVSPELLRSFRPQFPLILGGVSATEQRMGLLTVRFKKHRWHRRLLKTSDPLIFSVGWRRFQGMPIYAMEDKQPDIPRLRYLKYTPEHMHCLAAFYGPLTPPGSGILAYQFADSARSNFRISGTGVVIEQNAKVNIVKKLKLTGTPFKIFKNTAYIKDMFSSALEVAKFEGAAIRSVSGIRGAIKKAVTTEGHDGLFRATFEDKILASDIIFCRTWATVEPVPFYNPVTSLLDEADKKLEEVKEITTESETGDPSGKNKTETSLEQWQPMRTTAELRRATQTPIPQNKDSEYKPIQRSVRRFNPLHVPQSVQRNLPYASAMKLSRAPKKNQETAFLVRDKEETRMASMMNAARVVHNSKESIRKEQKKHHREEHLKKLQKEQDKHEPRNKELRKRRYIAQEQGRQYKQVRYSAK